MRVAPLGLGSSYGLKTRDVERAIERGVNYIYWGAYRRPSFAEAIRNLGPARRSDLVIVAQTYTRLSSLMSRSLERALKRLGTDYIDLLLLGWWNSPPPRGILEAALALKRAGKVRGVLVSCHHRPSFEAFIDDPAYDGVMVRYNAAHTGAEGEVFPLLSRRRPGVVAYTATRWGTLLDPRLMPPGEPVPRASDCYRFALSNPAVDVCLSGPANGAELDEAFQALDRGPLSEDEAAWMRRVGAHVHAAGSGAPTFDVADRVVNALNRISHVLER
jgi:aryl-alcohol dehydrogenase-like predicted oxidoreductase